MKKLLIKGITLTAGLMAGSVGAVPSKTPPGLSDVPPGRVKEKIQTLPEAAQRQAVEWLQRLQIPAADYQAIDIDREGGVFYVEPTVFSGATSEPGPVTSETPQVITETDAFALHSKPGAARVIYLDFDGHVISGTAWNSGAESSYNATPYDRDGNLFSFSESELRDIAAIWHRIAEDFAAFDVDVTTEEPVAVGPNVGRLLITRNSDVNGVAMPHSGAGGVAYVGVWGRSNYEYYQPALVYYNNLGGGVPRYVVEAASHEMGHNLGLSHDGTLSGSAYYGGHGSGLTSWGPIMGVGYNRHVSQWSKGDYADANNQQDDISIIQSKLSFASDDHGDSDSTATLLVADTAGQVYASNPETDLYNYYTDNKGVIETRTDVDVFQINAGAGTIDLTITPAWDAFLDSNARGANLDVLATLTDVSGNVVQSSNPQSDTVANINVTVGEGVYYLSVTGVGYGSASNSYDDYGSQGMYFVRGSIPVGGSEPGNQAPIAQNDTAGTSEDAGVVINVLANDSDPDGDALTVTSVTNGTKGTAFTDGSSIMYTPSANQTGTDNLNYSISDGNGGFSSASITVTISPVNDAPVANNDSTSTEEGSSVSINVLGNDSDVDGDTLTLVSVGSASNGSTSINGNQVVYSPNAGFTGNDSFTYQIRDAAGVTATATVSVTVTEKVEPPVTPGAFQVNDGANGTAVLSWSDTSNEIAFEIQRESKHKKRNSWNGTTIVGSVSADITTFTDASGTGTFRYRVRSHNGLGASAWTGWAEVTVTGGSGGKGGKGGGKGRNK